MRDDPRDERDDVKAVIDDAPDLPTRQFVVLVVIARFVNTDPRHEKCGWAWPSAQRLAERTRMSKKSVLDAIDHLEALGLLKVKRGSRGRRQFNHYRITLAKKGSAGEPIPTAKGFPAEPFSRLIEPTEKVSDRLEKVSDRLEKVSAAPEKVSDAKPEDPKKVQEEERTPPAAERLSSTRTTPENDFRTLRALADDRKRHHPSESPESFRATICADASRRQLVSSAEEIERACSLAEMRHLVGADRRRAGSGR